MPPVDLVPLRKSMIHVELDETRRVVIIRVDSPTGGFVAPLNPEEATIIGMRLLDRSTEAAHNIATDYRPPPRRRS